MTISNIPWILLFFYLGNINEHTPRLELPRPTHQETGLEIFNQIRELDLVSREEVVYHKFREGNIPDFMRKMVPVRFAEVVNNKAYDVEMYVTVDYLGLGNDSDYFLMPLSPSTAKKIGQLVNCTLPTRKMADIIWKNSPIKLKPQPIPPSEAMTSVSVMHLHDTMVKAQRDSLTVLLNSTILVSGHKKDVVMSNRKTLGKVHIYGWHNLDGTPIQPLYSGHTDQWVDYSHGIRLVFHEAKINGVMMKVEEILKHKELHFLLSDEGVF
jgi:hypothetical protein